MSQDPLKPFQLHQKERMSVFLTPYKALLSLSMTLSALSEVISAPLRFSEEIPA